MSLRRLSIAGKVYSIVGACLVVAAVIGVVLVRQTVVSRNKFELAVSDQDLARVTQVTFKKQVQEWKNLLIRGDAQPAFEKYASAFAATEKEVATLADSLVKVLSDSATKSQAKRFMSAHVAMGTNYHEAMADFGASGGRDYKAADKHVNGQDRAPTALLDSVVAQLQVSLVAEMGHQAVVTRNTMLALGALLFSLIPLVVFSVRRDIQRPLKAAIGTLDQVAGGDLSTRMVVNGDDEIGKMGTALNRALETMESSIIAIGMNAKALAAASEELSALSTQMGSNAEETSTQAGVVSAAAEQVSKNVQTVASGTEEMAASIKEIAANASQAATVAQGAVHSVDSTNATIMKLGESSEEIGNVLKAITSIAEQTNLLALNATIEAARAGEAGKGFAVVANEVKELAKETARATEDITRKIEAIQGDTRGAVTAIGEITTVIRKINDISGTIASAVEEQASTTSEIGRNVEQAAGGSTEIASNITGVATAAQSTAAGAQTAQQASRDLAVMAAELQRLVGRFQVGPSTGTTAPAVVAPVVTRHPRTTTAAAQRRRAA
jgi:methyl-accepting chemotaxis protein